MSRKDYKRMNPSHLTAYSSMLLALSLIVAYIEGIMPLQAVVPIPGVKLGLANIVIVLAVLLVGYFPAFIVMVLRCVMSSLLFGSVTTLAFSLSGGLLSFAVSSLLIRLFFPRSLSLIGISVAGAAAHNIGQIAAAAIFRLRHCDILLPTLLDFRSYCDGLRNGSRNARRSRQAAQEWESVVRIY
ncbi:MAG: Gx transporter family protein [Eubacteriales bacterium]